MKKLSKLTVLAFAALSFTFTSCGSKTGENAETTAEGTTEAAGTETDSTATTTEGDTAIVQDQPVQDGIVDSTATK